MIITMKLRFERSLMYNKEHSKTESINHSNLIKDEINSDVPKEILSSWERAKFNKINPLEAIAPVLSEEAMNEKLRMNTELIRTAKPYLRKLYQIVEGTGFRVMLSDSSGCILFYIGDDISVGDLEEPVPGTIYSEEFIGTNSIGTSLITNDSIQVWAEEHYCKRYQVLVGSTSPIRNKDDVPVGTVTLAGNKSEVHLHTLGMSIAVADAISRAMQLDRMSKEKQRLLNEKNAIFQTISEGLLVIDQTGMINECNSTICELFKAEREKLIGEQLDNFYGLRQISKLIKKDIDIKDIEVNVRVKGIFINVLLGIKRITDSTGKRVGSIISLRTMNSVNELVHKMISARTYYSIKDFYGNSSQAFEVREKATVAAKSLDNILIIGESGTGKEIIAHSIHELSNRRLGPFIVVNCSGVPANAVNEEIFGISPENNVDGKPGKLELAEGGTLFLDDIGNMSMEMQNALCRVVEDKIVSRIGSSVSRKVDVRIIASANELINEKIAKGLFRSDLYYRLSSVNIYIPPIRERRSDIKDIITHLLKKLSKDENSANLSCETEDALVNYDWMGNVREIESIIKNMIINTSKNQLDYESLPEYIRKSNYGKQNSRGFSYLDVNEKSVIIDMLKQKKGNIRQTAIELGIARSTLYEKMKKYDIKKQ